MFICSLFVETVSIIVGEHVVQASKCVRNIGAFFDTEVKMNVHVTNICKPAWYKLFIISRIRKFLTVDQTKSVIHAYVTSKLDSNNSLLLGTPQLLQNKIQEVQNAAAKLIVQAKKREHVTPILYTLHWLPIEKHILFKTMLIVFKCLHGNGPEYIQELIVLHKPARQLRSSMDEWKLQVPKSHSVKYGDCCFSVTAPSLWNNLPLNIKSSKTLAAFKNSLKTYLFSQFLN